MYIEQAEGYYIGNDQAIRRANFLLLIQPHGAAIGNNFKCLVRKVAMRQCGHFMMGYARVYGKSLVVSGSYGGDGLPMTVDEEIYNRAAVRLPDRLYELWAKGGGWNSAGSEAEEMRKWALENLEELKK